jgi:hypothetical protein
MELGPSWEAASCAATQYIIYGTRRFIIVFTRAHHWSLHSTRSIQSIPPNPISPSLILSTKFVNTLLPRIVTLSDPWQNINLFIKSINLYYYTQYTFTSVFNVSLFTFCLIYNNTESQSTATCFGLTWPSSGKCLLLPNRHTAVILKS